MTPTVSARPITVALLGNPNTGKSTLFSALAGVHQRTGNYPGVTVEKKTGRTMFGPTPIELIDLPGTYSLAPHSPDEMVTVDVLLGRQADSPPPDVILCIVDASNLSRNLYLVSQALDLHRPTVVALNMIDVASERGIEIDLEGLRAALGVPVVPMQANRGQGLEDLKQALAEAARTSTETVTRPSPLPAEIVCEVEQLFVDHGLRATPPVPRYLIERLLLDTGYLITANIPGVDKPMKGAVEASRARLTSDGQSLAISETVARYAWAGRVLEGVVRQEARLSRSWSDHLDQIVTHRVWGMLIFALIVLALFFTVFVVADWFASGIELALKTVGDGVQNQLRDGPLRSLLVDGVIAGVGGVLVFLPQICILFLLIAILEDCGYMARAAYLMDRLMSRIGLSGKSFIPLLSSFACAVPGIMATRVIENRRDRLVTILIAPLMSCSARLPVYTLLVTTFLPTVWWRVTTVAAMYLLGMVTAVVAALCLKRTLLAGDVPPFVLELPGYKFPDATVVFRRVFERALEFLQRAGSMIFAVSIIVWALAYYPQDMQTIAAPYRARQAEIATQLDALAQQGPSAAERIAVLESEQTKIANTIAGESMRHSFLGRAGQWIEPIVRPLGWDWRIGCAVIASFPAREVVVSTLSVIYNLGQEGDTQELGNVLASATWETTGQPVFTRPVALSLMVFFALCAQCVSTLVVIRRETGNGWWALFCFAYMTALAYVGAFLTYQLGTWIGL